jgi:hypothetical protein
MVILTWVEVLEEDILVVGVGVLIVEELEVQVIVMKPLFALVQYSVLHLPLLPALW